MRDAVLFSLRKRGQTATQELRQNDLRDERRLARWAIGLGDVEEKEKRVKWDLVRFLSVARRQAVIEAVAVAAGQRVLHGAEAVDPDEDEIDRIASVVRQAAEQQYELDKRWRRWMRWAYRTAYPIVILAVAALAVWAWELEAWWIPVAVASQAIAVVLTSLVALSFLRFRYHSWDLSDAQFNWILARLAPPLLLIGLADAVLIAGISAPGTPLVVLIYSMLFPVTGVALLMADQVAGAVVEAGARAFSVAPDPFPGLVLVMVAVLDSAASQFNFSWIPIPPRSDWETEVKKLERAARAMETNFAWVEGTKHLGADARLTLTQRGRRVAAWLRGLEAQLMAPSPIAGHDVEREVARGLVGVCTGEWSTVEREAPERLTRSRVRQATVRLAIPVALAVAAWLVPGVVGADTGALRGLLLVSAITALVAPAKGWSDASDDVKKLLTRADRSSG